jgi:NADPH-dependent 2,4-dienoyl-CoA reductase/sulfur reductase-like enzyme
MKKYKYVIIGGGTTAGYAAQQFVEQGIEMGELCIISAESIPPMNRPPLSKEYLKDKSQDDEILVNEKEFYHENGIDLKLETCARSVDFGSNTVELDNSDNLKYDKLLIATGSKLKRLGVQGSDLDHIFYLRNIKHSDKIREAAQNSQKVVVVGGGYIGSETAAALSEMDVHVTMIIPEDHLLAKFTNDEIGEFFTRIYGDHGIDLIFENEVVAFHGDSTVKEVELASGDRIPADLVVIGIGVEPNIKLFEDTALKTRNGIEVNAFCETRIKNVYAAGDVAVFPDPVFGKTRKVEHWENSSEQGKHAAKVMSGFHEPYKFVPYFFSDFFDRSYEYFGDQSSANYSVTRGDTHKGDFSHWWFNGNQIVAAFIMDSRPQEERELAREWIRSKTHVDKDRLADDSVDMEKLVLQSDHHRNEPAT